MIEQKTEANKGRASVFCIDFAWIFLVAVNKREAQDGLIYMVAFIVLI